jgi:hypothetical protein
LPLPCGCPAVAVFNALKKHPITYKKIFTYREKPEAKREAYQARLRRVPVWKRVYVDESD